MTNQAPFPSISDPLGVETKASVAVFGCGGCGMNLARNFAEDRRILFNLFDTSLANAKPGETVHVLTDDASGSGSLRSENASIIDKKISRLGDDELRLSDVGVFIFSLAGGSGSVVAPLLMREYIRKGKRVVGVVVADTSSAVGANNTSNTLKSLMSIAKNIDSVIPLIVVSNDDPNTSNRKVDETAIGAVQALLNILLADVSEIDRNDRLNWINPRKVIGGDAGLRMLSFQTEALNNDPMIILGTKSDEMVDSLMIIHDRKDDYTLKVNLPFSKLKKTGIYINEGPPIIGTVSSDIQDINNILDNVDKMQNMAKSQTYKKVDRLESGSNNSGSDLVL